MSKSHSDSKKSSEKEKETKRQSMSDEDDEHTEVPIPVSPSSASPQPAARQHTTNFSIEIKQSAGTSSIPSTPPQPNAVAAVLSPQQQSPSKNELTPTPNLSPFPLYQPSQSLGSNKKRKGNSKSNEEVAVKAEGLTYLAPQIPMIQAHQGTRHEFYELCLPPALIPPNRCSLSFDADIPIGTKGSRLTQLAIDLLQKELKFTGSWDRPGMHPEHSMCRLKHNAEKQAPAAKEKNEWKQPNRRFKGRNKNKDIESVKHEITLVWPDAGIFNDTMPLKVEDADMMRKLNKTSTFIPVRVSQQLNKITYSITKMAHQPSMITRRSCAQQQNRHSTPCQ
jgi:hypothetical protein